MKFRKLTIASAVCAALAGVGGVANAAVTGLPGEALLVVGVVTGAGEFPTGQIETNIGLRVPTTIGTDAVINQYTAPHTSTAGTTTVQVLDDPRIYWAMFNENSVKVESGYCHVSPGDVVLWTTDPTVRGVQQVQQAGIAAAGIPGIPSPICGPTLRNRFNYVIFQTNSGADGQDADFAFAAEAEATILPLALADVGLPVFPMGDGADPLPAGSGFPAYMNEVITGPSVYGDGFATSPNRYSPIIAGIRLSDADAFDTENVITHMPIPGPAGGSGMALHVLWYPNNDPNRLSYGEIFDDAEGHCDQLTPLPRQLNAWLYNSWIATPPPGFPVPATWVNMGGMTQNANGFMTDLIANVNGHLGAGAYCAPPYWNINAAGIVNYPGALVGYRQYQVAEFNFGQDDGSVHAAGVQFSGQQNLLPNASWSLHMASDLGKQ
jgi:hypothetical protein